MRGLRAPWTQDKLKQLHDLAAQGRSSGQITTALGRDFTRSMVVGMAWRRGIQLTGQKLKGGKVTRADMRKRIERQAKPAQKAGSDGRKARTRHGPVSLAKAGIETIAIDKALPPEPPAPPQLVALRDLGLNQCRFPFGDPRDATFGFCGKHADGDWCAEHRAIVYTASKPKPVSAGPEVKRTRWPSLGWGRGKGID